MLTVRALLASRIPMAVLPAGGLCHGGVIGAALLWLSRV